MVIKLINIRNLEHRVEALERPMAGIDPLEIAISNLSDNELGLLSEYRELYLEGFTVEEIRFLAVLSGFGVMFNNIIS